MLEKLYRQPSVCEMCAISRATLYRWVRSGLFPRPIRMGRNSVAWPSSAIEQWQRERMLTSQNEVAA